MKIHIVQKGDTMWKIARRYGVDFKELLRANSQLKNPDLIYPGMKIKVPSGRVPARPHHHSDSGMGIKERPHKEAPIKEAPIIPPPVKEEEVPPSVETRPYESPEQPAPPPPPPPQIQQVPTPPAPIPTPPPAPVVPPPAPQIKVAPTPAPPVIPQPIPEMPQIRPFIKQQQPIMPYPQMPSPQVSPFMQPRPMMPPVTIMPLPPMPMPPNLPFPQPNLPFPQPQLPFPQPNLPFPQPNLPFPQPHLPIPQMQPRPYCPPCHAQRYHKLPIPQEPICPPALMPERREAPWEMEDSCESSVRRMPRSSDETSETVLYHHHHHRAIPESYDNPYMRGYTGGHPSSSTNRSYMNSSMYPAPQLMPPMPGHEVWPRWEKGFEESSSLYCTD